MFLGEEQSFHNFEGFSFKSSFIADSSRKKLACNHSTAIENNVYSIQTLRFYNTKWEVTFGNLYIKV